MAQEDFQSRTASLDQELGVGKCFDMTARNLLIAGRRARLWVVNGYAQETILERIIAAWQSLPSLRDVAGPEDFCARYVSASDAAVENIREKAVIGVFAGKTLLVVDGWPGGILMDVKQFPTRSIEEPDTSRVLRGSHDGFVENLMQNAALLRRRVRDSRLRLERVQLKERSGTDVVLCDTAGRLHNKQNLMNELAKLRKIIDRECPDSSCETLLVLDATTGQNGLIQARTFKETAGLTGIILTKLDGTAKGGIVVAIAQELQVPVKFVGVGEGIDDLKPFDAKEFVQDMI